MAKGNRNSTSGAYFGCWEHMGHFLYDVTGRRTTPEQLNLPWRAEEFDGRLCPGWSRDRQLSLEEEGEALVHHRDGWTALGFWDRSLDKRYNSVSVFFLPGLMAYDEVLMEAKRIFPKIWKRFSFQVRSAAVTGSYRGALK